MMGQYFSILCKASRFKEGLCCSIRIVVIEPTAPCNLRRSPIQVLNRPDPALCLTSGVAVSRKALEACKCSPSLFTQDMVPENVRH